MSYRTSRRRAPVKPWRKYLPYGGLFALVGVIGLLSYPTLSETVLKPKVRLDELGCLKDEPSPSSTALLVDATDALTDTHQRMLANVVEQMLNATPDYGRISVFVLQPNGLEPTLTFSRCAPVRSAHNGKIKGLIDFRRQVSEPLMKAVNEAAKNGVSDFSPIFETIVSVSRSPEFVEAPAGQRHLYVVSDFLQNSSGFSAYSKTSQKKLTKRFISFLNTLPASNLNGASLQTTLLMRSNNPLSEKAILTFLDQFRAQAGIEKESKEPTLTNKKQVDLAEGNK